MRVFGSFLKKNVLALRHCENVRAKPSSKPTGTIPSNRRIGSMPNTLSSVSRRISARRTRGTPGTSRVNGAMARSRPPGTETMRGGGSPAARATARTKSA